MDTVRRILVVAVISCGPVGGLLIGVGATGSATRTIGFILLGVFLIGGVVLNIWTVRRTRNPRH